MALARLAPAARARLVPHVAALPDLYRAVLTTAGWLAIPKELSARVWLLAQVSAAIAGATDFALMQRTADAWAAATSPSLVPKLKKPTRVEISQAEELLAYKAQIRGGKPPGAETRRKRPVDAGITFTHAWNFYMAQQWKLFDMPSKEKRAHIALLWRNLSVDQKDYWREQYQELLELGRDIYKGAIVSREAKAAALKSLFELKQRVAERKKKRRLLTMDIDV